MAALDWTLAPFASLEREFDRLRRQMDTVFGRIGPDFTGGYPPMNIYDLRDEVVVALLAPGIRKEDLAIEMRENTLSVSGRRAQPEYENTSVLREECIYGEFRRTVRIESKVKSDAVEAKFQDGILWVRLPKSEEGKPKQISINT